MYNRCSALGMHTVRSDMGIRVSGGLTHDDSFAGVRLSPYQAPGTFPLRRLA